jgi:hypothetical protein
MARKTPILLRRAPISGRINVLTNYSRGEINGQDTITVRGDGKHDVTTAFYALMLEELLDGKTYAEDDARSLPTPDLVAILDGVADGLRLSDEERAKVRAFRERLKSIVEAHNARIESGELERA